MEDSTKGEFHGFMKKKIWVDKKSGHKCMMLYPRGFTIAHGAPPYWDWDCYDESSNESIEVAILKDVCRLQLWTNFKMSDLTSGVNYEIALVVKLTTQFAAVKGWEHPFIVTAKIPNEARERRRQYDLLDKPREEWMELIVGTFQAEEENREVSLYFSGSSGEWKSGLIVKGVCIRPKN